MSKFKIGDKVRVKYIPGVTKHCPDQTFEQYPHLRGVQEVEWVSQSGYIVALSGDPYNWWFCEDSLETFNFTNNSQRTLLGLETEYKVLHDRAVEILYQMNLVGLEIQRLKELEE